MANEFEDMRPNNDNTSVDLKDDTLVDELEQEIREGTVDALFQKFALWCRTKMWRTQVRETIARIAEYTSVRLNELENWFSNLLGRQEKIEERQTKLEERYKDVLSNATVDSEVIDARNSENYGKFLVLNDRLENIEQLLVRYVPVGFDINIKHELGVNPTVYTFTWLYGLGVVPIGTEPDGMFGGTPKESIPCNVVHKSATECVVSIPYEYANEGELTKIDDTHYLMIDYASVRSIMFELHY